MNVLSLFFNSPSTTSSYTLSLHDALPISVTRKMLDAQHRRARAIQRPVTGSQARFANTTQAMPASRSCPEIPNRPSDTATGWPRSEEHTSELQSHLNLVCRLLLEKKTEQQ